MGYGTMHDYKKGSESASRDSWRSGPIAARRVSSRSSGHKSRAREEAPRRVLLVDDNAELRQVYGLALECFGAFRVFTACDGHDAIAKARAVQPDVIVTDYCMPAMDGGELARRLRADERTRDIPVVMLSAFDDEVSAEVRQLCAAFVAKPGDPEELSRLVTRLAAARASL